MREIIPVDQVKGITDNFHALYYSSEHTWNMGNTTYMGIPCFQNPMDMWILQEIMSRERPNIIIETGTCFGGSSLFFAHMMDLIGITGFIFSIDTQDISKINHFRVIKLIGKSTDEDVIKEITNRLMITDRVMVILDSDHSVKNVLAEMRIYAPMVSIGQYMIVMDSNVGGNPIHHMSITDGGPMVAINEFLKEDSRFIVDKGMEKFYFTFAPNGWLKKVK